MNARARYSKVRYGSAQPLWIPLLLPLPWLVFCPCFVGLGDLSTLRPVPFDCAICDCAIWPDYLYAMCSSQCCSGASNPISGPEAAGKRCLKLRYSSMPNQTVRRISRFWCAKTDVQRASRLGCSSHCGSVYRCIVLTPYVRVSSIKTHASVVRGHQHTNRDIDSRRG